VLAQYRYSTPSPEPVYPAHAVTLVVVRNGLTQFVDKKRTSGRGPRTSSLPELHFIGAIHPTGTFSETFPDSLQRGAGTAVRFAWAH